MEKKFGKVKLKYIVLLLILFVTSQIFATPCGDVNVSGVIDIVDALITAQYYVGLNPQPFDVSAADVNGDGAANIIDALLIARYYVGLITTLQGCEPTVSPTCTSQTYELQAETDATWDDATVDSNYPGYTGTGFVNTANSSGRWIEWNIDVSADSSSTCVFTFANGSSSGRSMDVSINGSAVTNLGFPATGAWDAWSTDAASVILAAGSNTIRLTATNSAGAPNMDKMDIIIDLGCIVTPTPSPVPTPTLPGSTPSGNGDIIKIMCLGDSITESDSRENSWRYMLVQNLYEAGYKGAFDMVGRNSGFRHNPDTDWDSEHCGYWSASADQLLNGGLPKGRGDHGSIKDWAPAYKPTMALIHLGTNDSRGGQSPESTLKDIEGIINHLRAAVPEVKIVVAQIIPIGKSDAEKVAQDLNSKIPAWAESINTDESPVKVVDMHSDMVIGVDQGTYHPYGAGSQKMADKWFAAIREWFET